MSLLPDRHPNLDFFVLDIADAVPKDDMATMEHPLFSLATKPDMRHLEYRSGDNVLKIRPSGLGLPTIFDKDILIFVISQLMHRKNRGEAIGETVRFSARELCVATNRQIGGDHYKRLENAFARLQGTQFVTNVRTGGKIETRIFSLIDEGGFVRTDDERFRLDYCEVKLSRWLMRAIESDQVVTISNDYFRLRRPLERRLYEIARKHCGSKPKWQIGLTTLQNKTGSNAPIKRFRHNLREIIRGAYVGHGEIGFGMRGIAVEIADVVANVVIGRPMMGAMQFVEIVEEFHRRADEYAIFENRIVMEGRQRGSAIKTIHAARIPVAAVEDIQSAFHIVEGGFEIGHGQLQVEGARVSNTARSSSVRMRPSLGRTCTAT